MHRKRNEEGLFKNCVHLDVGGGSNGFTFYPYHPHCKEDLLVPYNQGQIQDRCPEDCSLFKDKAAIEKAEKSAQRRKAWKSVWKVVVSPFIWFAKLPESTQKWLVIPPLVVLIALVYPQLLKTILEIIRALK